MGTDQIAKRSFSTLTLEEAMRLIPATQFAVWQLAAPIRPPSDILTEFLRRLRVFNLTASEAAKILLMDVIFAEIVPDHANLRIWKTAPLSSDTLTGYADYLIAPDFAYITTPLLCVAEAKKDDFEQGRVQCVAEMAACIWNNRQKGHEVDVYGIVSNGQVWQFYRLTQAAEIYESPLFTVDDLPHLLGALDAIIARCAQNAR